MSGLPLLIEEAADRLNARKLSPELEALAARYDNAEPLRKKHEGEPDWKRELREHREANS